MSTVLEDVAAMIESSSLDAEALMAKRQELIGGIDSMQSLASRGDRWSGSRQGQGIFYYMVGKHDKAVNVLKQEASSDAAKLILASAAVEATRPDVALDALEGLKGKAADTLRARALLQTGEHEEAGKLVESVTKGDDSFEVKLLRQFYAVRTGDLATAVDLSEQMLNERPDDRHALFNAALLADRCGEDDRAIELYEKLVQQRPIFVDALLNLGVLYEDRDQYDHAIRCYRAVLADYPIEKRARLYLKDAEASTEMYYDEDRERKEDKRMQVLRTPVTDFELSVRSRNCLQKMNIETLGDLIQQTEQELLAYKNFGETSLQEIKSILGSKGLRLGMGKEEALRSAAIDEALERDKPKHEGVLAESVDALELSVRARKCMERMGVRTIGELCEHNEQALLTAPNFGTTSLIEVKRKLAELGLSLAS